MRGMNLIFRTILLLLVWSGCSHDVLAATHKRIVFEGQAAIGGGNWWGPEVPRVLTAGGTALFAGSTTNTSGLFRATPSGGTVGVAMTSPVPGVPSKSFINLDPGIIATYTANQRGDILFFGGVTRDQLFTPVTGLFVATAEGPLMRLAMDGDVAPEGSTYTDLHLVEQPEISSNGKYVVFNADLFGAPGQGLYLATINNGAATVQRIAYTGGPSPDGGTWKNLIPSMINVRGLRGVTNSGLVVFLAETSINNGIETQLYSWNGSSFSVIPGTKRTEKMMLNNAGQLAALRENHLSFGTVAGLSDFLTVNNPAPDGGVFSRIGIPVMNEVGEIAFTGRTMTTVAPIVEVAGVFVWSQEGGIKTIMRGSAPPPGGGAFSTSMDEPHISDNGQVFFLNNLQGSIPTIFMGDGNTLIRVIGKGDSLDGDIVKSVNLADMYSSSDGGESLASHGPVNARGQLAYHVEFNGSGKEGIYRFDPEFPEPDLVLEQPAGTVLPAGGGLAFGPAITGTTRTLTLRLRNRGELDVTGIEIALLGTDSSAFDISELSEESLTPEGTVDLEVTFTAATLGDKSAILSVLSNDPDDSPYQITLTGTSIPVPAATVKTKAAAVNATTATLKGTVDPKGVSRSVVFDYGFTASYGTTVTAAPAIVTGTAETEVTAELLGLLPHGTYHFRTRVIGDPETAGNDMILQVPNRAPSPMADVFHLVPGASMTLGIMANDSDADGDLLSLGVYTAVNPASAGKLTKSGDSLTFTASKTFAGAVFTYTVKDAFGGVSTAAAVTLALASVEISPENTITSSASTSYPVLITADGAWSVVENLPWVTVNPASGVGNGTVQVTLQANAASKERQGIITIGGQPHLITQAGVTLPTLEQPAAPISPGIVGGYYELLIPTTSFPVTYTVTGMPPGLAIDAATGLIKGIPTKGGRFHVTVKARNAKGAALVSPQFDIDIASLQPGLVGAFHGYVEPNPDINGNMGSRLEMTTTLTGAWSGKLITGSSTVALRGTLLSDVDTPTVADCVITIPRKNASALTLALQLDHHANALTGTLKDQDDETAAVSGWRNQWKATLKATDYTGLHTFRLTNASTSTGTPQGFGFGSFKLSKDTTGSVTLSGKAADGSAFATTTFAGPDGELLVYQSLYNGRGSLGGILRINTGDSPTPGKVAGTVNWFKPSPLSTSRDTLYKPGFGPLALSADGGLFPVLTPGGLLMNLIAGAGNTRILFGSGGLDLEEREFGQTLTISNPSLSGKTNSATIPANANKLTMPTLNAANGSFGGSFVLFGLTAAQNRTVKYSGQIVHGSEGPRGYGYFILSQPTGGGAMQRSGNVLLRSNE